jgi:hypothetical protein
VNVPLIVAGPLAILGAASHGVGGEVLVVRRLSPGMLPSSRFGMRIPIVTGRHGGESELLLRTQLETRHARKRAEAGRLT